MEERFIKMGLLFTALFFIGCLVGMGFEQYERNQCRIEAIRALVNPELIKDICK